jgi:hypothetical protein
MAVRLRGTTWIIPTVDTTRPKWTVARVQSRKESARLQNMQDADGDVVSSSDVHIVANTGDVAAAVYSPAVDAEKLVYIKTNYYSFAQCQYVDEEERSDSENEQNALE